MYLFHSIMSGILLFCYNCFFFSNNFVIIYEICKFEMIIYISQHVGYCEDAFILSSNCLKNLLLYPSRYSWIHHTTLQRFTLLEYFYHHPMSCGKHFPKASYVDFTNNSILGQFFIFSQAWSNFPKPHFLQVRKLFFTVSLDKLIPWLSRKNKILQYPDVVRAFSSTNHL